MVSFHILLERSISNYSNEPLCNLKRNPGVVLKHDLSSRTLLAFLELNSDIPDIPLLHNLKNQVGLFQKLINVLNQRFLHTLLTFC